MSNILFISYFFNEKDGVGALRSLALYNLLKARNKDVSSVHRNTFNKNFILWTFQVLLYILKSKPKTIYISCGPYYHLYPITILCVLLRIRLIVDFRDPWSLNIKSGYGQGRQSIVSKLKGVIATQIEKRVYNASKYFIVCTIGMKDEYTKIFKNDSKILMVSNGHNINLRNYNNRSKSTTDVSFVCIGKFAEYGIEKAVQVLNKIKEFSDKKNIDYTINLIGSEYQINSKAVDLSKIPNNKVHFYARTNYHKAIKLAGEFDIGICTLRNEKIEYGTKVFDYIGLGIPIIGDFNKKENFYRVFKKIIVEDDIPTIPHELRNLHLRENIFNEILYIFEEE